MRDTFLPFSPPDITEEEIAEVVDTLRSDWITTGPKVRRFETEFAEYVGAPAAVAVNSCTAATMVALAAMGIGPGDAVLTTTMTFVSTVHVIEHVGATPVLVDIDPATLNLDLAKLEEAKAAAEARGLKVRAVIPVHFAGLACDMAQVAAFARRHGIGVVEDAAHSLPTRGANGMIGAIESDFPHAVAFSFYATKNLTTAEGGMLTGSPELMAEARLWVLHGMNRDAWNRYGQGGSWYYEVVRPGFKCNMTDISAALGLHQLARLEGLHRRRVEIASLYDEALRDLPVELPPRAEMADHAWHLYPVRLHLDRLTIGRDEFISELGKRNIGASVHFIPVHRHPYYRDRYELTDEAFPVASRMYERLVSLPLNTRMTNADVHDVVEALAEIVRVHGRID